jgi:hypothetical protein
MIAKQNNSSKERILNRRIENIKLFVINYHGKA